MAHSIRSTAIVTLMQLHTPFSSPPEQQSSSHGPPALDLAAHLQLLLAPRFVVERELAGGAMSTVYLARDTSSRLPVAVKLIADPDPDERARFRREAAVTARLRHPNILPLLDAGEDPALIYLVTPFVNGGSLRDRLDRQGTLTAREAARILHALASALAHSHAHGIIHGDVKPENILLAGDHVLLADFGAARLLASTRHGTINRASGEHPAAASPTVGTPRYMSPEQALGDPHPDPRSDIYSLAVVGVELLTGRPPFSAPTTRAILLAHLSKPAPSLVTRTGVPLRLARILDTSLRKRPDDRPPSAAVVARELAPLLERPIIIPFGPALVVSRRGVAAGRRVGRLAGVVTAVSLSIATVAAALLLLVGLATPTPDGVRVARGGVDSAASDVVAPTSCGSTRIGDAVTAGSRGRAG